MTVNASIVVPSFRGAQRLPVLFSALEAQTDSSYECIVAIDGDEDGSADVVREWSDRIPVRAVVFPANRGRPWALNAGFDEAEGQVLIRCDDDLEPDPRYVERHIAHQRHGGPRGVVGCYLNVLGNTPYARLYGRRADEAIRQSAANSPDDQRWRFWAGNVSVSRATWERVGPYDTDFRFYGWEDVDWGYRLWTSGVPIVIDAELATTHHAASDTTAKRIQRAFYSGAARDRFERKHGRHMYPPATEPSSAWTRLVSGVAGKLSESRVARLGKAIDGVTTHAPEPVGRRLIGLAVESSFKAGHERPGGVGGAL